MNVVLLSCVFIVLILFSIGVKISLDPGELGSFFAYRSKNSMRSEHTWVEGNSYAGKCLMIAAPFQILLLIASENYLPMHPTRIFIILVASSVVSIVFTRFLTESRLSRLYFKDGKRRPNSL